MYAIFWSAKTEDNLDPAWKLQHSVIESKCIDRAEALLLAEVAAQEHSERLQVPSYEKCFSLFGMHVGFTFVTNNYVRVWYIVREV